MRNKISIRNKLLLITYDMKQYINLTLSVHDDLSGID